MADPNRPEFTCVACGDQSDNARMLPCGCIYCRDCLLNFFLFNIGDRVRWPPQCCGINVGVADVLWLDDEDLQQAFQDAEEESSVRNPLYCSRPQCSALLSNEQAEEESRIVTCVKCGTSTCKKCKQPAHGPADTECEEPDLDPGLRELAEQQEWKRCPHCRRMISRMHGCPHIRCQCGGHFCYLCGKSWTACTCQIGHDDLTEGEYMQAFGIDDDEDEWEEGQEIFERAQENIPPNWRAQRHMHPLTPTRHPIQPPERGSSSAPVDRFPPIPFDDNHENPLRGRSSYMAPPTPPIPNPLNAREIPRSTGSGSTSRRNNPREGSGLWSRPEPPPIEQPSLLHRLMDELRVTTRIQNPFFSRRQSPPRLLDPNMSHRERIRRHRERGANAIRQAQLDAEARQQESREPRGPARPASGNSTTAAAARESQNTPGPSPSRPLPRDSVSTSPTHPFPFMMRRPFPPR
ncbi:uncharacterized protein GGS22DRAFT_189698 [Annulohypoxylon maeteangense]|uniref:uncharacterized protein n=1 Tax=Annulohypoxylon maeteangense TaxID=1927788 RepID=UPI00200785F3|nr:uncharacterized protein GGS22DRAFT_189698 [Annulohypoxylon maeteangense]KAI0883732.1 hypothetical protein GGS22DRAFT_189698 [Annulohypoxylon maeteangense]